MAIRKIKSYEDNFDFPCFAEDSLQMYIKANELLANNKREELLNYVTEFAFPIMTFQTERKTIKWNFIKSNEMPLVVRVRTQSLFEKENVYAQITVRFNTRQILAVYDRFGYLIHGSDAIVKDVLEYVVFEKCLSDYNSIWRLHAKINPDWLPKKDSIYNTFVRGVAPEPPSEEELKFQKEGIISSELNQEKSTK